MAILSDTIAQDVMLVAGAGAVALGAFTFNMLRDPATPARSIKDQLVDNTDDSTRDPFIDVPSSGGWFDFTFIPTAPIIPDIPEIISDIGNSDLWNNTLVILGNVIDPFGWFSGGGGSSDPASGFVIDIP